MTKPFPARLHVLLARDAPSAVVIRRGPSRFTSFIGWNRENNRFTPTQWLRGRVYERRSDLSPDGKHLIYFAMNGQWSSPNRGSWTAISKAPWMKAVVLYAKGDCWFGGGLFLNERDYWLNGQCPNDRTLDGSGAVRHDPSFRPKGFYGGECPGVYYLRLQRDGWEIKSPANESITVFEKPLPKGWLLRKLAHAEIGAPPGKGCYWDEHELMDRNGEVMRCPDWEWADYVDNRIVWAANGALHARQVTSGIQLGTTRLLHDFNYMQYVRVQAPY